MFRLLPRERRNAHLRNARKLANQRSPARKSARLSAARKSPEAEVDLPSQPRRRLLRRKLPQRRKPRRLRQEGLPEEESHPEEVPEKVRKSDQAKIRSAADR